jgi:hypothetical protein
MWYAYPISDTLECNSPMVQIPPWHFGAIGGSIQSLAVNTRKSGVLRITPSCYCRAGASIGALLWDGGNIVTEKAELEPDADQDGLTRHPPRAKNDGGKTVPDSNSIRYRATGKMDWHGRQSINISHTGILFQSEVDSWLQAVLDMQIVFASEWTGSTQNRAKWWGQVVREETFNTEKRILAVATTISHSRTASV